MNYIFVFLLSIASAAVLFVLTKIIGNKQISEMNMFDYIVGITIGSIGAEMATGIDGNAVYPVIAMAVYAFLALGISLCSNHSLKLRRYLSGRALVLMSKGKLYKDNLKRARMDLNEFLTQCRLSGFFDLSEIDMAFLEPNGKISFLVNAANKPASPKDLSLTVTPSALFRNVIVDGVILKKNLKSAGKDERWLSSELKVQGYKSVKDVFLATLDENGTLRVFSGEENAPEGDPFL